MDDSSGKGTLVNRLKRWLRDCRRPKSFVMGACAGTDGDFIASKEIREMETELEAALQRRRNAKSKQSD